MIDLNTIYNEDCLEGMKRIPDEFVDLTVTSPPYDNLRTYGGVIDGWSFEKFQGIAKELYRITKEGGVVVWVFGDATIKGSETVTSSKQALYFMECGFNLHDMRIFIKNGGLNSGSLQSYQRKFEYMIVFSKGEIKTYNLIKDRENKKVEDVVKKKKRPSVFTEALANDHILSWSNEGDIVFDPFMGSGTTGKMAIFNNRNFIGFELQKEYFDIAMKRIKNEQQQLSLF